MSDTVTNLAKFGMDPEGLAVALRAYRKCRESGTDETECIGRAIMAYAMAGIIKTHHSLKFGLTQTELPLEEIYPDIQDRYIAVHERNRALAILSSSFEEMDWNGSVDVSEFALFLALVQNEIEGP